MADSIRPGASASFPHRRQALAPTEATATADLAERAVALATEMAVEAVAHSETQATTLRADTVTEAVLLVETVTKEATEEALSAQTDTEAVAKKDAVAIGAIVPVEVPKVASLKPTAEATGEVLARPTKQPQLPDAHLHPPRTTLDVIIMVRVCHRAVATPLAVPHPETLVAESTVSDAQRELVRTTSMHRRLETMKAQQGKLVRLEDHVRIPLAGRLSDARAPAKTMNCSRAPLSLGPESGLPLAAQCPVMSWL